VTGEIPYEVRDGIARLTLNRSQARNALTFAMSGCARSALYRTRFPGRWFALRGLLEVSRRPPLSRPWG
jgi:hypothetical protein